MLLDRAGQTRATQQWRSEPSKDLDSQWAPESRARERESQSESESEWQNEPEIEPEKVRVNQSKPETQTVETSCRKNFLVSENYLFCLFLTKPSQLRSLDKFGPTAVNFG